MSQLVAKINGREVYSDKEVDSIDKTRVKFKDGSWCDVDTGQIVNKGPGYISIGSPEESVSEKVTEGPMIYSARNLEVRGVLADLDVRVHQEPNVKVTIVGPASEVKTIRVNHQGDTVIIEGEGDEVTGGGVTIISGRGSSVTRVGRIRGGSVLIGRGTIIRRGGGSIIAEGIVGGQNVVITGNGENQTKITVEVPKGAAVNLSGVSGNSVIGDTDGTLQVNASDGSVNAGRVANATLSVQGSSDINVREVNGVLTISIMGSGDVRVDGGKVNALIINVMGSGDASFNGQAETATLTVMGSGNIQVANVKNRPSKKVMGSGNIQVANW